MTDQERELINEKFKSIGIQMSAEFEVVHQSLKYIKDSVDLTNGRVSKLEANEIEHTIHCPQQDKIEALENDMIEWKMIRKYPKFFIIGSLAGIAVMFLLFLASIGVIG